MSEALVWLSVDLRLADNPALERAVETRLSIIPVFIWSPEEEAPWAPGAASRWWLHQSLKALETALARRGSKLIVRRGPAAEALFNLAKESGARSVFWNRRYEPTLVARDRKVELRLRQAGLDVETCPGNLLFEPGSVLNHAGKPYQVFTPFWRACLEMRSEQEIKPAPARLPAPKRWPASLNMTQLGLEPEVDWAGGMREAWRPGEAGAAKQLRAFLSQAIWGYPTGRDRPGHHGTSRLSPHLHFGEISARQVWRAIQNAVQGRTRTGDPDGPTAAQAYARQIAWREFSYHLLFHFPHTPQEPLRPAFHSFPWQPDAKAFKAWARGETGYPLIDAGMRELWRTGWMHNRVRMAVASFLVKHLLIRWQEGACWFWDTLVDADLANNTMGWQWSAGCGADAAPYFRIFNPVAQGEKFDPDGTYVRRWVPELARVPAAWIHKPWKAPAGALGGVNLGKDYPRPLVDHDLARKRALDALAETKGYPGRPASCR